MHFQSGKASIVVAGFAAITLTSLHSDRAAADDHPQEVLELIAAHHALEMKIRPLRDRLVALDQSNASTTGFQSEGVPLRAKVNAASEESAADADKRMPETLTHRDRATSAGDDFGRVKVRLSALEQKASAERERINRPDFGVDLRHGDDENGNIRFGDGQHGARTASGGASQAKAATVSTSNVDPTQIAAARRRLAGLQRELAALDREVRALEDRGK